MHQVTILWCKECGRYLQPPKHWVRAEPESKELLTFCTKRIKGLQVNTTADKGVRGRRDLSTESRALCWSWSWGVGALVSAAGSTATDAGS